MTATSENILLPAIDAALAAMDNALEAFMDPDCGETKADEVVDRLAAARDWLAAARDYLNEPKP